MKNTIIELRLEDLEAFGIDTSKIDKEKFDLISEKLTDIFDHEFSCNLDITLRELGMLK